MDPNYFKTELHKGFNLEAGVRGSVTLFGKEADGSIIVEDRHKPFAEHCNAESPQRKESVKKRRTKIIWVEKMHQADNEFTRSLHRQFNSCRVLQHVNFVLEGGSIDSDGEGTILTTSQCLLNPARNPGLSKKQIEENLKSSLGIQRILWLDHGHLQGDDTDSHIDTLVRFCSPDTITYVQCADSTDPHFKSLSAMEAQLKSFRQMDGRIYRFIPLPLPTACFNQKGQRLPASYANFLIHNGNVLAPVYGVDSDSLALAQLQQCFPQHRIVPVQCRSLIEQFGSLHCITMQML
jgi:agmatine deiminase